MLILHNCNCYLSPYRQVWSHKILHTLNKTDDKESLKIISINAENNRTSEITIPFDGDPSYFFLRKCEKEVTKDVYFIKLRFLISQVNEF